MHIQPPTVGIASLPMLREVDVTGS
jgi:hypothetical protein